MPKISIVIPVYNVQDYLKKCLLSCVEQDVPSDCYEIVIVNDGSTDTSPNILENFDWGNVNHIIINQTNQGLSAARNVGLANSNGEYVWFVDSDDWINNNSIRIIIPMLDGCDVLSLRSYFRNYPNREEVLRFDDIVTTGPELTKHRFPVGAPFYIYKRSFLEKNGFNFKVGIFHEDTQFDPRALYLAGKVNIYREPLYHNLKREGSITSSYNPKKIIDLISVFNDLIAFQNTHVAEDDKDLWGADILSGTLNEILYLTKHSDNKEIISMVQGFVNHNEKCLYSFKIARNKKSRMIGFLSSLLNGNIYNAYSILYRIRYRVCINEIK